MRVAQGCAGDAGDDSEDGTQSVVHSVDGVADPGCGLFAGGGTLGQQLCDHRLRVGRHGGDGRGRVVIADQASQLVVMLLLLLHYLVQDVDAGLVSQLFQLFSVARDVAALVDLQAAQRHARAANAACQLVGVARGATVIARFAAAEFDDSLAP